MARLDLDFFNLDWKYKKGEIEDGYEISHNDENWRYVSIPHSTKFVTPDDFKAFEGVSWYRKHFAVDKKYENKKIFVEFDGVMQSAKVWINGCEVCNHVGGYMGFVVDLTDYIKFGEDNLLVVRSDSRGNSDFAPTSNKVIDFQFHGGIYRDVYLTILDKVHITNPLFEDEVCGGGIFVTYDNISYDGKSADINIKTHIRNESEVNKDITLKTEILDESGNVIKSEENNKNFKDDCYFIQRIIINDVNLWHPNTPYLYKVRSTVIVSGEAVDQYITNIGIRELCWKKEGLFINGEKFSCHGANYHQDIYGLGNAMLDSNIYDDIKLIKSAGFDFIRCSHYPHDPSFYDACNKLGVICMDSMTGWQVYVESEAFKENTHKEIKQMIRRDRNHPCIVAWETSINEAGFTDEWGQKAHDLAHLEYPTNQMYTSAWHNGGEDVYPDIYLCAAQHGAKIKAKETKKPVIISEYGDWNFGGTESTTRRERGNGDVSMLTQCNNLEESLNDNRGQMKNGEICTDAFWVFQDYSPFSTEKTVIKCGVVDMHRMPKFSYYFYRSQKDINEIGAMVYIANHWNQNSPLDVRIYSNCEEVELFLNDKSMGRNKPAKGNYTKNIRLESGLSYDEKRTYSYENLAHPPFVFNLNEFEEGCLKAVGYLDGKVVTEHIVNSNKPAKKLAISKVSQAKPKDGNELILFYINILDENDEIVNDGNQRIELFVEGAVAIEGNNELSAVGGRTAVWVRAKRNGNKSAVLTAKSEGLEGAKYEINLNISPNCPFEPNQPEVIDEGEWIEEEIKVGDIAREKPAFADSTHPDSKPEFGNSGSPGDWWQAADNNVNHWWIVDTKESHIISSINIVWPVKNPYQYKIETTEDDLCDKTIWSLLVDKTHNEEESINTNDVVNGRGRYVKITITGNVSDEKPVKFNMFSVYGTL